jgi:hypothetical protein
MTKEEIIDFKASRQRHDAGYGLIHEKEYEFRMLFVLDRDVGKKNSTAGFTHTTENGTYTCIMKHDLGENWSLYHKTILELIFKDILNKPINISILFKC